MQHTEVRLVDDLSGGDADESIPFSLDGRNYEIDLTEANAEWLRSSLAPFVSAARRASGGGRPARRAQTTGDRTLNAEIREFARRRGMKCGDRGRIPGPVLEAYRREVA